MCLWVCPQTTTTMEIFILSFNDSLYKNRLPARKKPARGRELFPSVFSK